MTAEYGDGGEWENERTSDDTSYVMVHKPCGTKVLVEFCHEPVCPKCQPERWVKQRAADNKGQNG